MKRWLVNLLAALSLLLCLAAAVMWVRSYWVYERVEWHAALDEVPATTYSLGASSGRGGLKLTVGRWVFPPPGDVDVVRRHYLGQIEGARERTGWDYFPTGLALSSRHGFHTEYFGPVRDWIITSEFWTLVLPYWFLLALTAALPGFVGWRRWRAAVRRRRVGRCAGCGYDLRASPERCPECGRPVA